MTGESSGELDELEHWIELERMIQTLSSATKQCFELFSSFDDYERRLDCTLTPEIVSSIDYLWNHEPLVRFIYQHHRHEKFQLYESAEYWFENLYRISQTDYVPSIQDIMRLRIKTTGVLESKVYDAASGTTVNMILMGSQRNERKKWMTIIRGRRIGAILFVIALSEYNQTLYENDVTNRLYESICVFSEMLNSNSLSDVPVYLFLNKCDVFTEKLRGERYSDLSQVFPNLPPDLRKDELKQRGVYLLPKSYDSCVLVNWQENTPQATTVAPPSSSSSSLSSSSSSSLSSSSSPSTPRGRKVIISNDASKFEIRTTLIRTRTPTYATLNDWAPTASTIRGTTLHHISYDVMGLICSFLDIKDLCRVSQANSVMYMVSGQDFIWRQLYYRKLFSSRDVVSMQQNMDTFEVSEELLNQIYEQEVLAHETVTTQTTQQSSSLTHIRMGKWKCFVKYTSQTYYQKNINFILEELFQSTD